MTPEQLKTASISSIAQVIRKDYQSKSKPVHPHAAPYVSAMACMNSINDNYGLDDGRGDCGLCAWKSFLLARRYRSQR